MATKSIATEPVKVKLKINPRSEEFPSHQIATQLAEQIKGGRLPTGAVLPSENQLAEQLGVGRKVVRTAYGRLVEQRLIERNWPHQKRVSGKSKPKKNQKNPATAPTKTAKKGARKAASKSASKSTGKK